MGDPEATFEASMYGKLYDKIEGKLWLYHVANIGLGAEVYIKGGVDVLPEPGAYASSGVGVSAEANLIDVDLMGWAFKLGISAEKDFELWRKDWKAPHAAFIPSPVGGDSLAVVYADTSTKGNWGIKEWKWDFGDGSDRVAAVGPPAMLVRRVFRRYLG
jgi:hypothetical protein